MDYQLFSINFYHDRGGPANATDTLVTFAYRKAFRFMDFSGSAALSTFTFGDFSLCCGLYSLFT